MGSISLSVPTKERIIPQWQKCGYSSGRYFGVGKAGLAALALAVL
jgi:hypothetical protein